MMLCTLLAGWLFCYPSPPAVAPPYYDMRHQCYGRGISPGMSREQIADVLRREAGPGCYP